jgi:uncharacterized protein
MKEIEDFLECMGCSEDVATKIMQCAEESGKDVSPKMLEGKILHDAHLLEGGESFGIIKSLITGTVRGQSLQETIDYYKNNLQGKFRCAFSENEKLLREREDFANKVIKSLEQNIN